MFVEGPGFIVAIVLVCTMGWVFNNWIRARHGYPLEDEWGGKTARSDSGQTARLEAENRALHGRIDAMQDRLVVLEKIVTDRGYSLSAEIEALRDGSGVPLAIQKKETA
jgi:hypothetical protein